jgi:hypothetical protein
MVYMWIVHIDALFHLRFSDLWSDQYSLSHCEIEPKINPNGPGFHRYSMTNDSIANRRMEDERRHETAFFSYRLCCDMMTTAIPNCSKKCWQLRSWLCVETRDNGLDPVGIRTWNWSGSLDPLLTPLSRLNNHQCDMVLPLTDKW